MNILVLEDDGSLGNTFKEFFELCGYCCEIANDREAAILLLFLKKFDAIVADLPMQDFDYHDLFSNMKKSNNEKAKVFIVTQDDLIDNTKILGETGIAGIFKKPFSMEAILEKILLTDNKKSLTH